MIVALVVKVVVAVVVVWGRRGVGSMCRGVVDEWLGERRWDIGWGVRKALVEAVRSSRTAAAILAKGLPACKYIIAVVLFVDRFTSLRRIIFLTNKIEFVLEMAGNAKRLSGGRDGKIEGDRRYCGDDERT